MNFLSGNGNILQNPLYDALFAPLANRHTPLLRLADSAEITGHAFFTMIAGAAQALRDAGVEPGDRVAVQIVKSPQALAIYAATVAIGAVFLPLNTAYTAPELAYFIGNATPRVLICDPASAPALGAIAASHATQLFTLDGAAQGSFANLMANKSDTLIPAARADGDLAALLYTSGTTGRAKGAMLTHGNLMSNAQALAKLWQFTDRDVLLHALPIFHTHGLFVASNVSLLTGGRMIFLPEFNADTVLRHLPDATTLMGVPTFYTRLLGTNGLTRSATAHMRLFVSGSAPLLAQTHEQFHARTGHHILERYGMTETNMNTSNPYNGVRRAGTVGLPLPGTDVRIAENGAQVAQGQIGQIEVRGPNVFAGYWQMPDKTAEDLRPDGWFITGDLGKMDADGYLQIVGRSKDLIISGGYNIYPKEIELLLDVVPGVEESAVIGLPHPDLGEAVFAVLVAKPGAVVDGGIVLIALRDQLARFKQPRDVVVVDGLPRNAMGKVQKATLRATYADWFDTHKNV